MLCNSYNFSFSFFSKTTLKSCFLFLVFFISFSISLAAPTVEVKPASQNVNAGQKATIKITTTNSTKCTVTGDTYNKNALQQLNGNVLLSPTKTVNYLFSCSDATGLVSTTSARVVVLNTTGTNQNSTTNSPSVSPNNSQAARPQYANQTVQTEAEKICNQYSGFKSVYEAATASGGSSVPTDLTQLRPVLEAINKNTQLTANEMRAADMIRFCTILPNVANASNRLAQETAKNLKTFADKCYADRPCFLKRAYEADVENELIRAKQIESGEISQKVQKLIVELSAKQKKPNELSYNFKLNKFCNEEFKKDRTPIVCITAPHDEKIIKEQVRLSLSRVNASQEKLNAAFRDGDGIIGSRPCIKTYSGADPSGVFYLNRDCADHKEEPAIINQEVLKQIAALPYTQAYSPAAELGTDQAINNINSRVRSGNLVDPDISTNFGSVSGGGTNPISGGGNNAGTDLKAVEANYKKLLDNVKVITTLYDVAKEGYASTTSDCKFLPVETRAKTIEKIDAANDTYKNYSKALTAVWTAANKKPKENHLSLVTQINFDLKDKYNQLLIDKVLESVRALLKPCVDAANRASTS